jgi:hypothetical protein
MHLILEALGEPTEDYLMSDEANGSRAMINMLKEHGIFKPGTRSDAQPTSESSPFLICDSIPSGDGSRLLACLVGCLTVWLFACLRVCVFACLRVCVFACLLLCLFLIATAPQHPVQKLTL